MHLKPLTHPPPGPVLSGDTWVSWEGSEERGKGHGSVGCPRRRYFETLAAHCWVPSAVIYPGSAIDPYSSLYANTSPTFWEVILRSVPSAHIFPCSGLVPCSILRRRTAVCPPPPGSSQESACTHGPYSYAPPRCSHCQASVQTLILVWDTCSVPHKFKD